MIHSFWLQEESLVYNVLMDFAYSDGAQLSLEHAITAQRNDVSKIALLIPFRRVKYLLYESIYYSSLVEGYCIDFQEA